MNVYGRGALDPRWTTHHTPVVASFMLATVRIVRKKTTVQGAQLVYDQTTGTYNTGGMFDTILDSTPARIQPYGNTADVVVAQDTTGRKLTRVQIEQKITGVHLDDMIIVEASPENPELAAYTMEVRGVLSSSNAWLTDIVAEANLKADT